MAEMYAAAPFYVDPWQTTWLPQHYPVHHHAFEHTRTALSRVLHGLADFNVGATSQPLISPRSDAWESKTAFYLDIELPGLRGKEAMSLKWVSTRTLLLRAVVGRERGAGEVKEGTGQPKGEGEGGQGEPGQQEKGQKEKDGEDGLFMTVHERRVGVYGRAFNFPVDVDHDETAAKLEAGVLRVTVPKAQVQGEEKVDKPVAVETAKGVKVDKNVAVETAAEGEGGGK